MLAAMELLNSGAAQCSEVDALLLADEQEDMIDRYLERGTMYVLLDGGVKSECVVTDERNGVLEIKNIATEPAHQEPRSKLEALTIADIEKAPSRRCFFDVIMRFVKLFPSASQTNDCKF